MKRTVLCVRDELITPQQEGLIPASDFHDLTNILGTEAWAVPRDLAEEDPRFRQIIPYVTLVTTDGKLLVYRRSEAGTEDRLHDLWSVGIGGHTEISDLDAEDLDGKTEDCWDFLMTTALREVMEELPNSWVDAEDLRVAGVIRLCGSDVDRVHVGVWIVAEVPDDEVEAVLIETEDSIDKAGWATLDELKELNLEAWSGTVVDYFRSLLRGCKDQHCRDDDGA